MIATVHGEWGERMATEFLRREGLLVLERNIRPVASDRRLEIDAVAYDKRSDTIVFVEVKQHSRLSPFQRRLRSIDRRKRLNLRRAFNAWLRINRWSGSYRFDVVEVYGVPGGGRPVIDHIPGVRLFADKDRAVKWSL